MLGNKSSKLNYVLFLKSLIVGLIWTVTYNPAEGQVVLVSSKLRSSRPASKAKPKAKIKPQPVDENVAEALSISETNITGDKLRFVVTLPELSQIGITPDIKEAVKSKIPLSWPELLGFEFEVVKLDSRGHMEEKRKERARFYLEEMSGGVNLEMVEIPAGTFLMGSSTFELEEVEANYSRGTLKDAKSEVQQRLKMETPQRMVKVSALYFSKYEVTQAQWRAVASLPKVNRELMSDPSNFKGGNRPVEQISWEDAMEFCERLSRATGRRYRLPTEAEWEYACRSGTKWPFSFGETIETDWVNYNGKIPYAGAARDSNRQQTVPVGSLGVANAFGLYDMHGNVWEWCLDSWHEGYAGAPSDSSVWDKDSDQSVRVLRGGAWDSSAGECRSSERRPASYSFRLNNVGFRVVAEVDTPLTSK
ncbi:MAG: formylglycine-generating enzyme family protein [Blastocatellales bacterium]